MVPLGTKVVKYGTPKPRNPKPLRPRDHTKKGVSENTGSTLFWGPYNKDPTIKGTVVGSPMFGNSQKAKRVCSRIAKLRIFERLCHGLVSKLGSSNSS